MSDYRVKLRIVLPVGLFRPTVVIGQSAPGSAAAGVSSGAALVPGSSGRNL